MRIVNIDAPDNLTEKVVEFRVPYFVLNVVRSLEHRLEGWMRGDILVGVNYPGKLPHCSIRKFRHHVVENIANLVNTIPIYLRDRRPEQYDETDIVDILGAYFPNRKNDDPYIELYLPEINAAAKGDDLHFIWIFAMTLIHELAHAGLDLFNCERCRQTREKVSYTSEFGRWREESAANAATLYTIRRYGDKDFYDFVKQFMQSQSPEYALGVLMEHCGSGGFRSVVRDKKLGVNATLQKEWLKYVKGTPTEDGLMKWNSIFSAKVAYRYKGKYYDDAGDLVGDIVDDVLNEHIAETGNKMSVAEFQMVFPRIKGFDGMSYDSSLKSTNYLMISKKISLSDGDLYLSYCWDRDMLHQFVANIDCQFEEFENY